MCLSSSSSTDSMNKTFENEMDGSTLSGLQYRWRDNCKSLSFHRNWQPDQVGNPELSKTRV